jgi:hypothetical protein
VYDCLGKPRPSEFPMAVDDLYGGYKGLRIGKTDAREGSSDMGMRYDEMYWHYIDKFIFALCHYTQESGDQSAIGRAAVLVKQLHAWSIPCATQRL